MSKKSIILFGAFLILQVAVADLADEAAEQLEQLQYLVEGEIAAARDELDLIGENFAAYGVNTWAAGGESLEFTFSDFSERAQVLRLLGEEAGRDVSVCVDNRLSWMAAYLDDYKGGMEACINYQSNHLRNILRDSLYIVDVVINRVLDLEFQLGRCNGEILCIAPLMTEIERDNVRLPQSIKEEVSSVEGFVEILRPSVEECSNMMSSQYARESTSHLLEMANCINHIIDQTQ